MECEIVRRSFEIIGIQRKCLFEEYGTVLPETRERLNRRLDEIENKTRTELAVYEMTNEPVSPGRPETFYIGMVVDGESNVPEGMERVLVPEQTFATVTVKGRITEISNGYQALRNYIQERGWQQDNDSFMVELFDHRFDSESDNSEMEIFYPVKVHAERVELGAFRVMGLEIENPELGKKVRESVRWIRERLHTTDVWESEDIHCVVPPQTITADKPGFKLFVGVRVKADSPVPAGWSVMEIPAQSYAFSRFKGYLSECGPFYHNLNANLRKIGFEPKQAINFELYPNDRYDWNNDHAFQTINVYTTIHTKAPQLERIGVIFRHVDDLDKARSFYGETLGLQQAWQSSDGGTAYTTGSGPIIIVTKKGSGDESRTDFNFETPDISHAYRSMKASGVEVGKIKIAGTTSMFFFEDPDGHTMMVWANHLPDKDLPQYVEEK